MAPTVETRRVRRNWTEKFLLWPRAYETKIWQSGHEATARGLTPEASEEAAIRKWKKNAVTAAAARVLSSPPTSD
jgi:hypothetical protein